MKTIEEIKALLSEETLLKVDDNEKEVKDQVEKCLTEANVNFKKDFYLDKEFVPDFYIDGAGVLIIVRMNDNARWLHQLLFLYCEICNEDAMYSIKDIVVITNKDIFPADQNSDINIHVLKTGAAWL